MKRKCYISPNAARRINNNRFERLRDVSIASKFIRNRKGTRSIYDIISDATMSVSAKINHIRHAYTSYDRVSHCITPEQRATLNEIIKMVVFKKATPDILKDANKALDAIEIPTEQQEPELAILEVAAPRYSKRDLDAYKSFMSSHGGYSRIQARGMVTEDVLYRIARLWSNNNHKNTYYMFSRKKTVESFAGWFYSKNAKDPVAYCTPIDTIERWQELAKEYNEDESLAKQQVLYPDKGREKFLMAYQKFLAKEEKKAAKAAQTEPAQK